MGVYRVKIIVPLAGPEGEVEREFGEFKNLIEVYNKPLIKYITEKRPYDLRKAVFILLNETNKKYDIAKRLKGILGVNIDIFILDELTEGAPCSVTAYLKEAGYKGDILIDLLDQHLDLGVGFTKFIKNNRVKTKGIIPTFKSRYWKWSYIRLDKGGFVKEVQEKVNPPISDNATAGVYYFSNAKDFISGTAEMVRLDKRVRFNNKFFVSCVYNEFPKHSVISYPTKIICPLGSVEGIGLFKQIAW